MRILIPLMHVAASKMEILIHLMHVVEPKKEILVHLMHVVEPVVEDLTHLAHVAAPFVVAVEIVVLTIHFRERNKQRAERDRPNEMQKPDDAVKQQTDAKLTNPAPFCPACTASRFADQGPALVVVGQAGPPALMPIAATCDPEATKRLIATSLGRPSLPRPRSTTVDELCVLASIHPRTSFPGPSAAVDRTPSLAALRGEAYPRKTPRRARGADRGKAAKPCRPR